MFVIGEVFVALAKLSQMIFFILYVLLVIRIIVSWFQISPYNELVQILYRITEPLLRPFRRLPLQFGMIDFSPILAFIILQILGSFIYRVLMGLAVRFGT